MALTVKPQAYGRAIPAGFLGLSLEFNAIEPYAGQDPKAIDPVFEQLIRNLTPAQTPVIRIGGDTTDWTWWPVPHMAKPGGVRVIVGRRWAAVVSALTKALDARLILGINLEANSRRLATFEARHFLHWIGRKSISAFELGNEPELYPSFAWYVLNGHKFTGRPHSWTFTDFLGDVARIRAALPPVPLAGPAVGGPGWMPDLASS